MDDDRAIVRLIIKPRFKTLQPKRRTVSTDVRFIRKEEAKTRLETARNVGELRSIEFSAVATMRDECMFKEPF
jgi:hypothetical protein